VTVPRGYAAIRAAEVVEAGLRQCKPYVCTKCGAQCLRGDDADACAMVATVDAEPVDGFGEVLALLDGLTTYDIAQVGRKAKVGVYELFYRAAWHYLHSAPSAPVFVQHRCRKGAQCGLN
jgi:hypothetical protein